MRKKRFQLFRFSPWPSVALRVSILCAILAAIASCSKNPSPPSNNAASNQQSAAKSFEPTDPQLIAANNRGVGLMGKFEYENARQVFQTLADAHSDWLDVQVNLAIATLNRQREGDEDRAMKILEKVIAAAPNHLRANYCVGLLKLYLESPADALPHFKLVAAADPKDAYAAYYVGQCLAQSHNYDQAVEWYRKAIELDPYLRSGYYALSQSYRALGKDDDAAKMLDEFQRLERNPRARLVKFIYTLMGPKGEAATVDLPAQARVQLQKPEGSIFADPVPLLDDGDKHVWKVQRADRPVSITACDINGDGANDIFIANVLDEASSGGGVRNAVCINQGDGHFKLDVDHPLAKVADVNAALWGDYDNDGLTDVYLCRRGPNMLWRQTEKNTWQDVTAATGVSDGELDTVDGALFDADHDGDLDIFCVNADGPNELFNNNLDGTFRPIAKERGIAGSGKGSRQVLPVDLDGDRDLDIIVINNQPPHDVWINDRMWNYRAGQQKEFAAIIDAPLMTLLATDVDADGQVELDGSIPGSTVQFSRASDGHWVANEMLPSNHARTVPPFHQYSVVDIDGTGPRPLFAGPKMRPEQSPFNADSPGVIIPTAFVTLDALSGPSQISVEMDKAPVISYPGPGRHRFTSLTFTGKQVTKDNQQIRSNASGIGTHYAARIDSKWVVGDMLRTSSGPGQSLQPVPIGLGGQSQIDFVAIDWSDGVFQSEIDLKGGELHKIVETQRQLSSCPVLFAWNGTKYEFVTDLLGVGGIGYFIAPNEYAPERPHENLLLPSGMLQPKDGHYILKVSEPMEEACYLDAARLMAYDIPFEWRMTLDERMGVSDPQPTGNPLFYRYDTLPIKVTNDRGEDVTSAVTTADRIAAPVGEIDERFIGRLKTDNVLTLTFPAPIDVEFGRVALVADGWIEYPYSQTMFAAWQAHADYRAPTLEYLGEDNQWHILLKEFGYPAGMPRQMAMPLDKLPHGVTHLRLRSNEEIYWDRLAIAHTEKCEDAVRHDLKLTSAALIRSGFPKRTTSAQMQPSYDYDIRAGLWDTRHQAGWYTAFGRVDELISAPDGGLAIFGPGEEVQMELDADLPPLPENWKRIFVLETDGWCKDMDLYTKDGETIEPLPGTAYPKEKREALHRKYNTRYESGR